jgi:hypothetical protein
VSRNTLIVESKNDKCFFDAIIQHLNCNIEIAPPILISDEDYLEMNGLNPQKLVSALEDLKVDIQKGKVDKVGIIIDIDNESEDNRIEFVNNCIQSVFLNSPSLERTNELISIDLDGLDIQLACHFTNVNGQGELETILKEIKSKPSTHADCLDSWRDCIQNQDEVIKSKDFDKFWVDMYVRFDTCSNQEKKQAGRKCSMSGFDYIMANKKDIWNLDHPILNDLKHFFRLFC